VVKISKALGVASMFLLLFSAGACDSLTSGGIKAYAEFGEPCLEHVVCKSNICFSTMADNRTEPYRYCSLGCATDADCRGLEPGARCVPVCRFLPAPDCVSLEGERFLGLPGICGRQPPPPADAGPSTSDASVEAGP